MRHFLQLSDLTAAEVRGVLSEAASIKREVEGGVRTPRLANRLLLMWFEKPSTRTRLSFVTAMCQCGGMAQEFDVSNSQLGTGESFADTVRAVSGYSDAVMLRVFRHETLRSFAEFASCPVINGLSDVSHPCQILADLLTFFELRGEVVGRKIAWVGDCNNVAFSWAEAARLLEFEFVVACPPEWRRPLPGEVVFVDSPVEAARGAAAVNTDVWVSMGDTEAAERRRVFAGFQVDAEVMAAAREDALFMHCLPAHRGEEVTAEVIDGPQSAVWRQAVNRLHAQKALLLFLMAERTGKS